MYYVCNTCKDKKPDKTQKTNKTIWNDIGDICSSNLETVFKNILDDFQNDEINKVFDNPLSKSIHLYLIMKSQIKLLINLKWKTV